MPNNDLISREKLQKAFERECIEECGCCKHIKHNPEGCALIDNAPAVDAEPVVHSKWKMIPVNGVACYRCGNLKCARLMPFGCMPHELPRCPYCGAKMDKEE